MERRELNTTNYCISICIAGSTIDLYSSTPDLLKNLLGRRGNQYEMDIPGFTLSHLSQDIQRAKIEFHESSNENFKYDTANNIFIIHGKIENYSNGQVLAYITYWLSEYQRHCEMTFSMHAAALSLNEKGILLLGEKGSGKTSTLLKLTTLYKGKLIANDLLSIKFTQENNQAFITHGSKSIRIHLKSTLKNFPQFDHVVLDDQNNLSYSNNSKVIITPDVLGIETIDYPTKLTNIFQVYLTSNPSDQLKVQRVSGIEPKFSLYENLSRIIRGSAISAFDINSNFLGYLPSLETIETHNHKVRFIDYLLDNIGIYSITGGNLDEISSVIYNFTTN